MASISYKITNTYETDKYKMYFKNNFTIANTIESQAWNFTFNAVLFYYPNLEKTDTPEVGDTLYSLVLKGDSIENMYWSSTYTNVNLTSNMYIPQSGRVPVSTLVKNSILKYMHQDSGYTTMYGETLTSFSASTESSGSGYSKKIVLPCIPKNFINLIKQRTISDTDYRHLFLYIYIPELWDNAGVFDYYGEMNDTRIYKNRPNPLVELRFNSSSFTENNQLVINAKQYTNQIVEDASSITTTLLLDTNNKRDSDYKICLNKVHEDYLNTGVVIQSGDITIINGTFSGLFMPITATIFYCPDGVLDTTAPHFSIECTQYNSPYPAYIKYNKMYDCVVRSYLDANGIWSIYLSAKLSGNYTSVDGILCIPDSFGRKGIINTLSATITIKKDGSTVDTITVPISIDSFSVNEDNLAATIIDSEEFPDITTQSDDDIIITSGGESKLVYVNKKIYQYASIKDPDEENYTYDVTIRDALSSYTQTNTPAIYYADPIVYWNKESMTFNIPLVLDTNWNASVPMYINGVSLEQYIKNIKEEYDG